MRVNFTFSYNGNFYVSAAPIIKYEGKITFDGVTDATLILKDVNINDLIHFETADNIYGDTEKGPFSLIKCKLSEKRQLALKYNLIYKVKYAVNGRPIFGEERHLFSKAIFSFDTLSEWIGISGFEHGNRNPDISFETIFRRPPIIAFLSSSKFQRGFQWNFNHGRKRGEITLTEAAEFYIESYQPSNNPDIHLDEIYSEFSIFRDFLSILTLWPCNVKWMRLHSILHYEFQGKFLPESVQLHAGQYSPYSQDSAHKSSFLLPYDLISLELDTIYSKWIDLYDKIFPSIKILMEYIRNKTPFNSNKFLNLAQAIETYHRRTTLLTKELSHEEHKKRSDEILSSAPEQHRNYLSEILKTSNDMIFANRLVDLISGFDSTPLEGKFPNKTTFVTKVKNTRNYYTHYSADLESKALKGESLEKATTTLFFMLLCCICRDIGILSTEARFQKIIDWFEYVNLYSKEKEDS